MSSPRVAALIVNGKSRRGREWFPLVRQKLLDEGFELALTHLAKKPQTVGGQVDVAIRKGIPLVCVGGGDGTFSSVAGKFVDTDSVLGVLPLGTGNSLARDLGIKADVDEACQVLIDGFEQDIDLGLVNGQHFVNVATVGLTTRIAEGLDNDAKKRFGRAAYLVAVFKAVIKAKPFHTRLEFGGEVRESESIQVVVGSGRFHAGPFPVTPEAEITSGKLAGYSVNSVDRATLLRYGLRLWGGHHVDMPEVEEFTATQVKLSTTPLMRITVDGETGMRTPATFECLPQAVRVLANRSAKQVLGIQI
ncbi:MAG: hypothetical protein BGO01_15190 [Armatimonadetes bacterium 55-13]|nr:YegS/Rv2252/BmrU family lipid kinase [Armatimonadota bacterium]OJU65212.1 MAG: hypothetical protein BGO01_15190 [Armatimonadetes bacterium 55-13]